MYSPARTSLQIKINWKRKQTNKFHNETLDVNAKTGNRLTIGRSLGMNYILGAPFQYVSLSKLNSHLKRITSNKKQQIINIVGLDYNNNNSWITSNKKKIPRSYIPSALSTACFTLNCCKII